MIEAVNSVLSNAQIARGSIEQTSQARSIAANPERVQEVAKAPYISPYIFMDLNYDRAVLQLRDSDTGDVLRQYPSESQLEAYKRAQATSEQQAATVAASAPQPQIDVETTTRQVQVSQVSVETQTPQAPEAPAPQQTQTPIVSTEA